MSQQDGHDSRRMSCRSCGCRDLRVAWTYKASDQSIRRRRRCRHCGTEFTTIERTLTDDRGPERPRQ